MKHIRSALIAGLVALGGAAVASAQQVTPTPSPAPAAGTHAHRVWGRAKGGLEHQLFRGMTLSDAEKANIKNVQAKYAPQMKALRQQFRPQLKAARDARQRGDTTALKQLWSQTGAQRQQAKQLMVAERNDLRAALTPANQAKFDANVKQVEQRAAQRAQKAWKNGGRRADGQ